MVVFNRWNLPNQRNSFVNFFEHSWRLSVWINWYLLGMFVTHVEYLQVWHFWLDLNHTKCHYLNWIIETWNEANWIASFLQLTSVGELQNSFAKSEVLTCCNMLLNNYIESSSCRLVHQGPKKLPLGLGYVFVGFF